MFIQKIERTFEQKRKLANFLGFDTKAAQKTPWFRRFFKGIGMYEFFEFIHLVYGKSRKMKDLEKQKRIKIQKFFIFRPLAGIFEPGFDTFCTGGRFHNLRKNREKGKNTGDQKGYVKE